MSIWDSLSGGGAGSPAQLIGALVDHEGGIESVLSKLKAVGLGEAVESWLSSEKNQPLTAEHVKTALKSETLSRLAEQTGMDISTVTKVIAKHLPDVVDKLSPDGKISQALGAGFMAAIKSAFGSEEKHV
jgi:uncharacterized protein YidB (DUF937 family)